MGKQTIAKPGKEQVPSEAFRCECGNLLARLVPAGVEIKCRRCKRQTIIPLSAKSARNVAMENE